MAKVKDFSRKATQEEADRFWSKVDKSQGNNACWPWTGAISGNGYGKFRFDNRTVNAHRLAWFLSYDENPPNESLDHVCRNRACCNVRHLYPATIKDNTLRGTGASAINKQKTHCPKNHPYSGDNLYLSSDGKRKCRECGRIRDRERYKARYEKEKASKTNSSEMRDFASQPKLSLDIANEIRSQYSQGNVSQRKLARQYCVSQTLIRMIIHNKVWAGEKG